MQENITELGQGEMMLEQSSEWNCRGRVLGAEETVRAEMGWSEQQERLWLEQSGAHWKGAEGIRPQGRRALLESIPQYITV